MACKCAGRGHAQNFCFRAMASCVNTPKPGVNTTKAEGLWPSAFHSICRISQIARLYRVRGRDRRVLFGRVRFPSPARRPCAAFAAVPHRRASDRTSCGASSRKSAAAPFSTPPRSCWARCSHLPRDGPAQAARAGGRLVCLTHQQPRGGGRVRQADALLRGARFQPRSSVSPMATRSSCANGPNTSTSSRRPSSSGLKCSRTSCITSACAPSPGAPCRSPAPRAGRQVLLRPDWTSGSPACG